MVLTSLLALFAASATAQEVWTAQRIVAASYPPLAQQARIQGLVELNCTIAETGEVVECQGISGHSLLQGIAIENAKKWRFLRKTTESSKTADVLLRYEFILSKDPPVRRRPNVEFSFEYPNYARIVSEVPCADHVACTPEELKQLERQPRSKSPRAIP